MPVLERIFDKPFVNLKQVDPVGILVMALGVALTVLSGRLSGRRENRLITFKLAGLLIAAIGTLFALGIIGVS